jgi:hypothetical protein
MNGCASLDNRTGDDMADFKQMDKKQANDGSILILYQDADDDSWFVGRPGDGALDPVPMGSFRSADAARAWADSQFPGGEWRSWG